MDEAGGSEDTGAKLDVGEDASGGPSGDGGETPGLDAVVYAHSLTTLYRLDPNNLTLNEVGEFSGSCIGLDGTARVVDLAVSGTNEIVVSHGGGLSRADPTTAACTSILQTQFGNNLSYVPAGALDPSREVLVSYTGAQYQSLDVDTGEVVSYDSLPDGVGPSGDIVAVEEGGTFVTTNDGGGLDELKEVDASTGAVLEDWGALDVPCVYGLAYWGGTAFGFTCEGDVVSIDFVNGGLDVTLVEATGIPFAGAGSSTKAPIVPEG